MSSEMTSAPKRCAIYTRKSTNSRLELEVNSLTTQHEICAAYIASQQYRGWVALPKRYDDGGHSGSGLERPALAALMHDIEAGEVDAVVVYKIDRLTRSLLDFVRLILLRSARAAQALFDANRDLDLAGLARKFGRKPGYFSRLIRLNYLAPDIVASIADGTQPQGLTRKSLAAAHIPLDWSVQRKLLGFGEPVRPTTPRNLFGRGMWPNRSLTGA